MIQIILITKDSKIIDNLSGGEYEFCRISSESIISDMIDLQEYDAAVIDIGDIQSDVNALFSVFRKNTIPVVCMGEYGQSTTLMQSVRDFDSLVLLKDPEYQFLQFIPGFVRKILRDKDKDKTVEEGLLAINTRHENLLQAIPDIIYRLDIRGYFTYVNGSVEKIGYHPKDLIGKHFSTILAPEDADNVSRKFVLPKMKGKVTGDERAPGLFDERRGPGRNTTNLEVRIRRNSNCPGDCSDSEIVASILSYGEVSATGQYRDEGGEKIFTGTVGIIRDVTSRKKSEQFLYLLSIAMEQSRLGICIVDLDGNIEYANPHFSSLNGVAHDVMLEKSIHTLWRGNYEFDDTESIFEEARKKAGWYSEFRCPSSDTADIMCWIRVYAVQRFGDVTHFVIFQENVRENSAS